MGHEMNETEITVGGRVVADPEHRTTRNGIQFTIFRIASTVRRRSREGVWVDGPTSFYNVATYRALGVNAHQSLGKGDPVVVHGRLTINDWQRTDGSWGSSADIEAMSVGHDLTFGTTEYSKAQRGAGDAEALAASEAGFDRMRTRMEESDGPGWGTAHPAPAQGPAGEVVDESTGEVLDPTEADGQGADEAEEVAVPA
ncbi:MAG: single-stranded DNA-binding protein [Kytococcus sp.]|nr:single-stranded DNA-binding protein [Kytococcus sp.]